ncbi:MAG: hypothetical protein ACHREM_02670 [Polyangiales bacterium]
MGTATGRVRENADAIVDVLATICERVRRLYSDSRSGMSLARFDIGVEIRNVMDDDRRYGRHGVRRIAAAVGRDEDSLYRYALLPAAWSREGFAALCARPSRKGVPLSLSHFILIAEQPEPVRERLVRFALAEAPSVIALRKYAKELASPLPAKVHRERPAEAVLQRGLRAIGRRLAELELVAKRLPDGHALAAAVAAFRKVEATLMAAAPSEPTPQTSTKTHRARRSRSASN